jgi:hypothetical protein
MTTLEPPTRVGELREVSLEAVRSLVAGSLFEMSPELENRIAILIEEGNRRLLYETPPEPGQPAVDERTARENLRRLIQAMVDDASARQTNVLDVQSMNRALSGLCPLPPWCR